MDFVEILRDLVEGVEGAVAATVMGTDGLAVMQYSAEGAGYDIETVGIEYGKVIGEAEHASNLLNLGELEEVTVATQDAVLFLKMLTPEYYLVFLTGSGANRGRARYLAGRAATKARKELLA